MWTTISARSLAQSVFARSAAVLNVWREVKYERIKAMAHINSLNGELAEITVLEKIGDNDYIVEYKGMRCHALFNWFVCEYYADDVYGIIKE